MLRQLILALVVALPAAAQDRAGRDTPGEWRVTEFETFGIWESICDERGSGERVEQRCYIRRVDVFSPHPAFAAQFVFVTPGANGPTVSFGMERGTRFLPDGFRVDAGTGPLWRPGGACPETITACTFEGDAAAALLAAMAEGKSFRFDFLDRHGAERHLDWPLAGFPDALAHFRREASARGLM